MGLDGGGVSLGLPDSVSLDMRLTWQYKLTEKMNLQFTAEGFNVANHTNFASVNNEVRPYLVFNLGSRHATWMGFAREPHWRRNRHAQHAAGVYVRFSQTPNSAGRALELLSCMGIEGVVPTRRGCGSRACAYVGSGSLKTMEFLKC
jgi:hypothetical protein